MWRRMLFCRCLLRRTYWRAPLRMWAADEWHVGLLALNVVHVLLGGHEELDELGLAPLWIADDLGDRQPVEQRVPEIQAHDPYQVAAELDR